MSNTDFVERVAKCVRDLDAAWREPERCYAPAPAALDDFSESVRYMHIFLRTNPNLTGFQHVVAPGRVREAIAALEAAWHPENPAAAQGHQRGCYDTDLLRDEDVRAAHVLMKALFEATREKMKQEDQVF